jgi:aryl-alcohol dehydrogenase-like predicted oxidoreductase
LTTRASPHATLDRTPDLGQLSAVGFGTYRVDAGVPEHERALRHAFALGCNLIDTATVYGAGGAEALIGRVLRDVAPRARPFVVTKAGYARAGRTLATRALADELAGSRERLGLARLDGVLLHNPELQPDGPAEAALVSLEEQAAVTGVSTTVEHADRFIELKAKLGLPRFRVLQLPFNLVETAAVAPWPDGRSTLDRAHAAGLVVIANRPLHAKTAAGSLRLAGGVAPPSDPDADRARVEAGLRRIALRLEALGAGPPESIPVLRYLGESWEQIPSAEAADAVFQTHLAPLLARLWDTTPPAADSEALRGLRQALASQASRNEQRRAEAFRTELVATGRLAPGDERPMALRAVEYVLDAGFDHVLVGMRRERYVDALRPLLRDATHRSTSAGDRSRSTR